MASKHQSEKSADSEILSVAQEAAEREAVKRALATLEKEFASDGELRKKIEVVYTDRLTNVMDSYEKKYLRFSMILGAVFGIVITGSVILFLGQMRSQVLDAREKAILLSEQYQEVIQETQALKVSVSEATNQVAGLLADTQKELNSLTEQNAAELEQTETSLKAIQQSISKLEQEFQAVTSE